MKRHAAASVSCVGGFVCLVSTKRSRGRAAGKYRAALAKLDLLTPQTSLKKKIGRPVRRRRICNQAAIMRKGQGRARTRLIEGVLLLLLGVKVRGGVSWLLSKYLASVCVQARDGPCCVVCAVRFIYERVDPRKRRSGHSIQPKQELYNNEKQSRASLWFIRVLFCVLCPTYHSIISYHSPITIPRPPPKKKKAISSARRGRSRRRASPPPPRRPAPRPWSAGGPPR